MSPQLLGRWEDIDINRIHFNPALPHSEKGEFSTLYTGLDPGTGVFCALKRLRGGPGNARVDKLGVGASSTLMVSSRTLRESSTRQKYGPLSNIPMSFHSLEYFLNTAGYSLYRPMRPTGQSTTGSKVIRVPPVIGSQVVFHMYSCT